jgi:hypothetical protein
MFLRLFRVTYMMAYGIHGYPTQCRCTGRSETELECRRRDRDPDIVPGDQGLYDSDHGVSIDTARK